jgi:hypothetical protein
MELLKEFIEVTAQYDGREACIRASLIEGITDNAEQRDGEKVLLESRTIYYAGHSINVIESYDEIVEMIYHAEL